LFPEIRMGIVKQGFPKLLLKLVLPLVAACAVVPGHAATPEQAAATAGTCEAIMHEDFAGIPDAATSILEARHIKAEGANPSHCKITGVIAPQIQYELRLPDEWNGRYLQSGCGGFCGFNPINSCADGQARGFAVGASNLGHVGGVWAPPVWATEPQLRRDFGGRATHVLALAAKVIIERYYGKKAERSYFKGCSTGGREGLQIAQDHPEDFDGIIAGDPAFAGRLGAIWNNWVAHTLMTPANRPVFAGEDLVLLNKAVLNACDAVDGLKDGILTDPRQCRFDPGKLLCRKGVASACLSADQVAAARAMYGGARNSAGVQLHPGGAPYGSELDWNGPMMAEVATQSLRFLSFPEARPTYNFRDFDWDRDIAAVEDAARTYDPVAPRKAPDLRAFHQRGGRLIAYHGQADLGVPPEGLTDYYAQIWTREGGLERTREWFRLFMVPGMFHCRGGDVPDHFDMLTAIVDWVEQGKAPDGIVATQLDANGAVKRTRPLFAYPNVAQYKGTGDQNDAANWTLKPVKPGDDRIDWIWKPAL
jgi:pimeloyl-ACP methyl ester carboxylesterase